MQKELIRFSIVQTREGSPLKGSYSFRVLRRYFGHSACRNDKNFLTETSLPLPEYDWDYLTNPRNKQQILHNIDIRKGVGDLDTLLTLYNEKVQCEESCEKFPNDKENLLNKLAANMPNKMHLSVPHGDEKCKKVLNVMGQRPQFLHKASGVDKIGKLLKNLRFFYLAHSCGPQAYFLLANMARLERGLVKITANKLKEKGFERIGIPEIVNSELVKRCGFNLREDKQQIYQMQMNDLNKPIALVGTAEIPLAGYFSNKTFSAKELPRKLFAVSRCYRPEADGSKQEGKLYRVREFTKVEMFVVTVGEEIESEKMLTEIVDIQQELSFDLELHFRVVQMPSQELGGPAYNKIDLEALMFDDDGNDWWGEISSASNCLDYQARRLGIKYIDEMSGETRYAHTLNGTGCAIPRTIKAISEQKQNHQGKVFIPRVLQSYANNLKYFVKEHSKGNIVFLPPKPIDKNYSKTK